MTTQIETIARLVKEEIAARDPRTGDYVGGATLDLTGTPVGRDVEVAFTVKERLTHDGIRTQTVAVEEPATGVDVVIHVGMGLRDAILTAFGDFVAARITAEQYKDENRA